VDNSRMALPLELPSTLEDAHHVIGALRTHNGELKCKNGALQSENEELQGKVTQLEHQIEQFLRHRFGRRSERIDPEQYKLAFQELEAQSPSGENDAGDEIEVEVKGHRRRRKGHGRARFSKDLPRRRRVLEPESTTCACCQTPMKKIGEEVSEQLDYQPATCTVIETVRPKYVPDCECGDGVACAPPPKAAIPRSKATSATLAHVAVSKYVDHLPLVRQVSMLDRQGVYLSKQTLCGWIEQISHLLIPIERAQWSSVLSSKVLLADETTVKLQRPGQCKTAYLWGYLGDRQELVYDFSTSREAEAPLRALSGYESGTLVCDGYAGYNQFVESKPDVQRGGCWAHTRRKFYEAKSNDQKHAMQMLALIKGLYVAEEEAAKQLEELSISEKERHAVVLGVRQEQSVPVLEEIAEALASMEGEVLPKSPIGKARGYAENHWDALLRFSTDGAIPLDTNAIEREMRVVAVGRRNWTFCGSEAGGEWAARLYGLLGTCRLQRVNPFIWLQDVLDRVQDHPIERMAELTPRLWAPARRAQAPGPDDTS